jgi:hypothetical protein
LHGIQEFRHLFHFCSMVVLWSRLNAVSRSTMCDTRCHVYVWILANILNGHLYTHGFTNHWNTSISVLNLLASTRHFLAMDFIPGNITVSLNYTFQISQIKSSLHSRNLAIDFTASHTELNSQLTTAWVAPTVKKKTPRHWLCT